MIHRLPYKKLCSSSLRSSYRVWSSSNHQNTMMKLILVVALIGAASAQFRPRPAVASQRTTGNYRDIQTLRSEVENNGDGTYSYRYELSDGTIVEERGTLKAPLPGTDEPIQVAEGSYQFYADDGQLYQVVYRADENGFQPSGSHLPTPPPIPEEIRKSLDIHYRNAAQQIQSARPSPSVRLSRPRYQ